MKVVYHGVLYSKYYNTKSRDVEQPNFITENFKLYSSFKFICLILLSNCCMNQVCFVLYVGCTKYFLIL